MLGHEMILIQILDAGKFMLLTVCAKDISLCYKWIELVHNLHRKIYIPLGNNLLHLNYGIAVLSYSC